jgi:ABC-type polysaccharide/polyol phosphate export permease
VSQGALEQVRRKLLGFARVSRRLSSSLVGEYSIWSHLGWRDLQIRYASTRFGPWWSVANLSAVVVASALAVAFLSGSEVQTSVPKLAISLALWVYISASLTESTVLFEESRALLLNSTYDELTMVFRLIWRNLLIFIHNLSVVTIVIALFQPRSLLRILWLLPIGVLVASWLVFPVLAASKLVYWRRELRAMIPPIMQLLFFVTPVLWSTPERGPEKIMSEINPAAWILSFTESLTLAGEVEWSYLIRIAVTLVIGTVFCSVVAQPRYSVKRRL